MVFFIEIRLIIINLSMQCIYIYINLVVIIINIKICFKIFLLIIINLFFSNSKKKKIIFCHKRIRNTFPVFISSGKQINFYGPINKMKTTRPKISPTSAHKRNKPCRNSPLLSFLYIHSVHFFLRVRVLFSSSGSSSSSAFKTLLAVEQLISVTMGYASSPRFSLSSSITLLLYCS